VAICKVLRASTVGAPTAAPLLVTSFIVCGTGRREDVRRGTVADGPGQRRTAAEIQSDPGAGNVAFEGAAQVLSASVREAAANTVIVPDGDTDRLSALTGWAGPAEPPQPTRNEARRTVDPRRFRIPRPDNIAAG
jgi:hypothetical protein